MAAHVDDLSDGDLRRKLTELGASVGPITDTTRKLYLKKYKELLKNRFGASIKGKTQNGQDSTLGFSSDDAESEADISKTSRSGTRRRRSAIPSPKIVQPTPETHDDGANDSSFKKPVSRSRRSTRRSINLPRTNGDISESKSKHDVLNATYEMDISDSDAEHLGQSSLKAKRRTRHKTTPEVESLWPETEDLSEKLSSQLVNSNHLSPRTSTPTKLTNNSSYRGESSNTVANSLKYSSAFHGRLQEKKKVLGSNGCRFESTDVSKEFATEEGSSLMPSNCPQKISSLLLFGAVVFFISIGLVYIIGMRQWNFMDVLNPQSTSKNLSTINLTEIEGICDTSDCVSPTQAKNAIKVCHYLFQHLSTRAGKFECNEGTSGRNMTKREALDFVKTLNVQTNRSSSRLLYDGLVLFLKNKHWGVKLTSKEYDEKLFYPEEVWWLESNYPFKSLKCRLKFASIFVLYRGILILFLFGSVFFLYKLYVLHQRKKEKHKKQVYDIAEQIIGILKTYHAECKDTDTEPFIAVPHVRDMLIPISDRKILAGVWDNACQILEENESRVRVEYRQIAGEDNRVWKWVESALPEFNCKVWQGRAFENEVSGLNALAYSATSCLKIRNMFTPEKDMEEGWKTSVIDAVMEKCGENHEIVHIAIANDSSTPEGCVYVKFHSREAAGKAYKELHGCWFDGNLVTVKFLRLERYYEHYPEAQSLDMPLKPSNSLKLSLSHKETFLSGELLERS